MIGEFEKRVKLLSLDDDTTEKIIQLVIEVMQDFPCLRCPSKQECENFRWFQKWFGKIYKH